MTRWAGARRRWVVRGALVLLLAGIVAVGGRLAFIRYEYGVWSWAVGEGPPTFGYGGRDYLRASERAAPRPGFVRLAATRGGGGQLFGAPIDPGLTPTVLDLRYPDGRVVEYTLSGGP
jgi:hypothetical protein